MAVINKQLSDEKSNSAFGTLKFRKSFESIFKETSYPQKDLLPKRKIYISFLTSLTCKMNYEIKEIKTATMTSKGQICIPHLARAIKGFNEGSKISIIVYEDRVELRPMRQISEKLFPALVSEEALAKEWNTKEEDEAWKDL